MSIVYPEYRLSLSVFLLLAFKLAVQLFFKQILLHVIHKYEDHKFLPHSCDLCEPFVSLGVRTNFEYGETVVE